jgi:hypothetical protein
MVPFLSESTALLNKTEHPLFLSLYHGDFE